MHSTSPEISNSGRHSGKITTWSFTVITIITIITIIITITIITIIYIAIIFITNPNRTCIDCSRMNCQNLLRSQSLENFCHFNSVQTTVTIFLTQFTCKCWSSHKRSCSGTHPPMSSCLNRRFCLQLPVIEQDMAIKSQGRQCTWNVVNVMTFLTFLVNSGSLNVVVFLLEAKTSVGVKQVNMLQSFVCQHVAIICMSICCITIFFLEIFWGKIRPGEICLPGSESSRFHCQETQDPKEEDRPVGFDLMECRNDFSSFYVWRTRSWLKWCQEKM